MKTQKSRRLDYAKRGKKGAGLIENYFCMLSLGLVINCLNMQLLLSYSSRGKENWRCELTRFFIPFVSVDETLALVFDILHQARETMFHRDIQTPRRELKIRREAEYF